MREKFTTLDIDKMSNEQLIITYLSKGKYMDSAEDGMFIFAIIGRGLLKDYMGICKLLKIQTFHKNLFGSTSYVAYQAAIDIIIGHDPYLP